MAGDWIKMRVNLGTDPSVFAICIATGLDTFAVRGRLHELWSWADQHSISGHAITVTEMQLDALTQCTGFAAAMRKVGWLEGRDGALTFPHFDRHNGQSAKQRALATERKARQRAPEPSRNERDESHAVAGTKPGPEKRREEDKSTLTPAREPSAGVDVPPGKIPTEKEWLAECARFSVPDWYALEKFRQWEVKGFRSGNTPLVWKIIIKNYVSPDYINAGRPSQPVNSKPTSKTHDRVEIKHRPL